MASSQKKSTTAKRSGGGTRAKSGGRGKKVPQKQPIRREVTGGVLLVLTLFVFVSYFGVNALFLDFFAKLLKGLFGYGYWLAGPSLLLAGLILLFHHGRPVQLRTACALLTPVLFGSLAHMVLCEITYAPGFFKMLGNIWQDGLELESGGAISGVLANASVAVFSKLASVILFTVLLVTAVLIALRQALAALAERRRNWPEYEEEEWEEPERAPAIPQKRREKSRIDIPLDGETLEEEEEKEAAAKEPGRFTSFFRHKSERQRTPDQVLAEPEPKQPEQAPPPPPEEPAVSIPTPAAAIPEPPLPAQAKRTPPEPIAEEEKPEPPKPALKLDPPLFSRGGKAEMAKEVAAQTAALAAEIEEKLAVGEGEYQFPPVELLRVNHAENHVEAGAELRNNSRRLAETLASFNVDATPGDVIHGPAVTRYEFVLNRGVKLSKITNLADDIALALGATGVRIAPIPDKISVVGIEVPNKQVMPVLIRDVIESPEFQNHRSQVAFALGKDISGQSVVGDIGTLPHVLIAGTTGSGKSVCTNSLIVSLLYKSTPDQVRFIMVDPKMVELAPYNGIPHLLIPVVTDPKKAAGALQWAVYEMMKRYTAFKETGVKKLEEFNQLARTREDLTPLPVVVVVIDELADLMLVAGKEVEDSICRVAQMGRAAGMHLVIATQRPSSDVITGLMKANVPSRIAFAVASGIESRIILDENGAEKLVGKGDMLYAPLGIGKPTRVQGCFISPEEIEQVVSYVKRSGEAQYSDEVIAKIEESVKDKGGKDGGGGKAAVPEEEPCDELLPAAVEIILETGQASVSMLQRRLRVHYSRAGRLVDQMEDRGIVGPFVGSKPRKVLITRAQWQEMQMNAEGGVPPAPAAEEADDPPPEEA